MPHQDIQQVYCVQYQRLDEAEARGEHTACLRIKLMNNHICELEQQIRELQCRRCEAVRQADEVEHLINQKYEELRVLAARIVELEDRICFLDNKLADCTKEKEHVAAQLKCMTDRVQGAELEIDKMLKTVRTHEESHDKFIHQIDKLMADNQDLYQEIVKLNKNIIELSKEKEQLFNKKKSLEGIISEMNHEIALFRDDAKERDRQMEYKCEEVRCLLSSLDEAQARVLSWQTRALQADQTTHEFTVLKRRVECLMPELQQVCSSNMEFEKHIACVKESLRQAQYEAECLREKVYTVSCECKELDDKYSVLLKRYDVQSSKMADLEKENKTLKQKAKQKQKQSLKKE